MNYKITFTKKAKKFIEKQNSDQQKRILSAISKLPDFGDINTIKGRNGAYRLRVGQYRIIYSKDDILKIISIEDADNRGQIYK